MEPDKWIVTFENGKYDYVDAHGPANAVHYAAMHSNVNSPIVAVRRVERRH